MRSVLALICRERGLNLLGDAEHGDPAQTRWDQLRASNVAIFELDASLAATCYDLGMALALGRAVVVIAPPGSKPPFDVDVEPVRIGAGDAAARERLSQALDAVLYGPQRISHGSSVEQTLGWLTRQYSSRSDFRVTYLLKQVKEQDAARDAIAARRSVEHLLGAAVPEAPIMIFPSWPMGYPDPNRRICFHVMPFGPEWAGQMMNAVSRSCEAAKVEYVRGDQVLDPRIILSIWNSICTATHIVVDLTGLNPNVALELGVARTLGRNVLLMTQDTDRDWSFTVIEKVRIHRYAIADQRGLQQLGETLKQFLS
jgi:nucleoside 2-deoxyribosyltransferase